jgi:uncharacterized protein YjdB
VKRRCSAAATAALLVLAVTGCLDALAPGRASHFSTRLVIAPQFVGNADSVEGPIDIDSIEIVVTRPPDPAVVARVGVNVELAGDSIAIPVEVPLIGAATAYHVVFVALSEGAPLYSGSQDVTVTAIPSVPTSLVAVYVGPGQNVRTVTLSPTTLGLAVGDSIALTWSGADSAGNPIPRDSIPARFVTSDSTVARVSMRGMVRGVKVGSARIVLTTVASTSIRDTATVVVAAVQPPLIRLSATSVQFVDTALVAATVAVTNVGSGTLSGLTVGTVSYGVDQPTGWLRGSLSATTAPTTLTLTAAKGTLAAGTYTANVPVLSGVAGNSPQAVSVTFTVAATSSSLASLVVTPGFRVMMPGDTMTLQVAGKDANGNPVTVSGLSFVSRYPSVATVNAATGLVTAVGPTNVVIVAQAPSGAGTVADSIMVDVPPTGTAVVSAQFGAREFAVARAGDTVVAQVVADLRAVPGELLGSYDIQLNWNAADLTYVRSGAVGGGFAAPTINDTQAGGGVLRFGSADPNGSASPVALIQITFVAKTAGTTSQLQLTPSDLSAAKTFTNLLPPSWWTQGFITIR